jgi:hypothetical protein
MENYGDKAAASAIATVEQYSLLPMACQSATFRVAIWRHLSPVRIGAAELRSALG